MTNYRYCYLLRSCDPKHPDRTYIGCTGDYRNRIREHNDEKKGGAKETERYRPWEYVAVVRGFSDGRSFESAWQNPSTSQYIAKRIGDWEKDLLAEKLAPGGDLAGVRGDLTVLKCLLNECAEDFAHQGELCVEFASEKWRAEFLKANYIFTDEDGSDEDGPDEDECPRPSIVPSTVNTSLRLLSSDSRKREFSNQAFNWEMLPTSKEVDEQIRNKSALPPEMWRKMRRISEAIFRADKRDSFKDEWRKDVLQTEEYSLNHEIFEQGYFYDFQAAISKAVDCFCNDSQLESSGQLEKLKDVAAQFTQFGQNYKKKFRQYVERHQQHLSVACMAKNFLEREQNRIQSLAPDTSCVADLIEKVRETRDIATIPTVGDQTDRPAKRHRASNKRHNFTEEQENDMKDILERHEELHNDMDRIRAEYPSL